MKSRTSNATKHARPSEAPKSGTRATIPPSTKPEAATPPAPSAGSPDIVPGLGEAYIPLGSLRSCITELGVAAQRNVAILDEVGDGRKEACDKAAQLTGEAFFWLASVEEGVRAATVQPAKPAPGLRVSEDVARALAGGETQRDAFVEEALRGIADELTALSQATDPHGASYISYDVARSVLWRLSVRAQAAVDAMDGAS